jgi:hypothetical protein
MKVWMQIEEDAYNNLYALALEICKMLFVLEKSLK